MSLRRSFLWPFALAVVACSPSAGSDSAGTPVMAAADAAPTAAIDAGPPPVVNPPTTNPGATVDAAPALDQTVPGPAPDAAAEAAPGPPPDGSATVDAGDATSPAGVGQYSCTLNATTPYHLGSEHRGYTVFGTVVDTTPGGNRERVGIIQSKVDTDDLVKWVWPNILVKGHSYELAVFEDHLKNRTCMGSATAEPQWLFKIPALAGDYEFKWVQPVPHNASCQDFPAGAIP
jgi:hypothetical protein